MPGLTKPSTWLVTGASSGIGKSIVLEAQKVGHKVIGTSRDISKSAEVVPELVANGGEWLQFDPGEKAGYEQLAEYFRTHQVDVLVNSAGYALIGGIEDTSEDEMREQMEVNFYGPLRSLRAVLPTMRERRSGNIVLISSGAGFISKAARAHYSASKFAIEAIHEALAQEIETFGIKVLIVEPGAFRTPFSARTHAPARYADSGGISEAYKGTAVEAIIQAGRDLATKKDIVMGNPDKAARAILDAVDGGHMYLRMILGTDCVEALETKIKELQHDLDATRTIGLAMNPEP